MVIKWGNMLNESCCVVILGWVIKRPFNCGVLSAVPPESDCQQLTRRYGRTCARACVGRGRQFWPAGRPRAFRRYPGRGISTRPRYTRAHGTRSRGFYWKKETKIKKRSMRRRGVRTDDRGDSIYRMWARRPRFIPSQTSTCPSYGGGGSLSERLTLAHRTVRPKNVV